MVARADSCDAGGHPRRRTITPPCAGKHSAQPSRMPARQPLEMPSRYRFHSTRPAPWKRVSVASSVDRQSKGGVTVSYSGYKRQRGERRRLQVRAKLREIRRNARHSIGRMDRGRSATIGCGETAPAQTALSCAGLSGRPALRQISAAARVRGLRGNFRPDFNGVKNCSANMRIGRQPRVLQTGAASGVPSRFS